MSPTRVAVIGAGTMGHGIAYVAARAGCEVRLTDARADALPEALVKIEALLEGGVKRGKLTAADRADLVKRLTADQDLRSAIRDADVVIEAIVEDLAIKQRLFADLEREETRSEEHTSELQSRPHLVCRLLLGKKKNTD